MVALKIALLVFAVLFIVIIAFLLIEELLKFEQVKERNRRLEQTKSNLKPMHFDPNQDGWY